MSFDLDKVLAEEEPGEPYEFTFDGEKYALPPEMDVRAVAAISGGRLDAGLRLLLGEEQWEKIQASPKTLTLKGLESLFDDYAEHTGTTMEKPSASTPPSKRTAKR